MFLAPNGKLFYAGEEQQSRWLDVTGTGSWTIVSRSNFRRRDYGSAAEYDVGKILLAGGGYTPVRLSTATYAFNAGRLFRRLAFSAPVAG